MAEDRLFDSKGRPIQRPLILIREETLHASGAETETVTGSDIDVSEIRAANFYLDVTAKSGTPSMTVKIKKKTRLAGITMT